MQSPCSGDRTLSNEFLKTDMTVFSTESFADHEQVVFISDDRVGLRAIIAVLGTRLGPTQSTAMQLVLQGLGSALGNGGRNSANNAHSPLVERAA